MARAAGNLTQLMRSEWGTFFFSADGFPEPLSAEAERESAIAARAGDAQARARLIQHNMRLVFFIMRKYHYERIDAEDMFSIGLIGLIKAADT